jgi:transposase
VPIRKYGITVETMSPMSKPSNNKHTMKTDLLFVGLDVHAQSITVAVAENDRNQPRLYGSIPNDLHAVERMLAKLKKTHSGADLRVCYEAGPTGFGLARRCQQLKVDCSVVAPSLIPNRAGDRIKTIDSLAPLVSVLRTSLWLSTPRGLPRRCCRDAIKLARAHRAGDLTAVHIPVASDEAMRDLCRARTDAVQDLRRSRAQLKAFLLRNGYRYSGKSSWSEAHQRYLRELVLPHPAQRVVLEDALNAITTAEERIGRLEEQMEALLLEWPMQPVVAALMALRGFGRVSAMVLVSELGGAWRFDHPRQLMAYLGLVPGEHTSDEKKRRRGITKTGNAHARWLLIEAAQHYRLSPKVSKELSARQQGLSKEIKACSWKAQTRLHKRMTQLLARGKERNKVTVAVARELCGFVWQIFRLMEPRMNLDAKMKSVA